MNTNLNSSTISLLNCKSVDSNQEESSPSWESIDRINQSDRPTPEQKKSIAQIYAEQALVYCQEHNWNKAIYVR